jgi:hypothetical protein
MFDDAERGQDEGKWAEETIGDVAIEAGDGAGQWHQNSPHVEFYQLNSSVRSPESQRV